MSGLLALVGGVLAFAGGETQLVGYGVLAAALMIWHTEKGSLRVTLVGKVSLNGASPVDTFTGPVEVYI